MFGASSRTQMFFWLVVVMCVLLSIFLIQGDAAPVPNPNQNDRLVTSPPDRLSQARDHHSSDHHSSDHQSPEHHAADQPSPNHHLDSSSHKDDECHFKNTEIALPITFSLEMPSYVMIGGHKFNIKLQTPMVSGK